MMPPVLKGAFVPGTFTFFLPAVTVGTLLLYRKRQNAGRLLLTGVMCLYWVMSTPVLAIPLVRWLSPDYSPVQSPADARGATAIVVLGAGMDAYRSRGDEVFAGNREHSLRALEAARVYRVLPRPWVIVTGMLGQEPRPEGEEMSRTLVRFGVPADRIVLEGESRSTHDHAIYVPPLLEARGVKAFVLVTSRQHMARALGAFRLAGLDPVPSSPEVYVGSGTWYEALLPSSAALEASTSMMYDVAGLLYYKVRGWA